MNTFTKKILVGVSALIFAYVTAGYVLGKSQDSSAFRALTVYSEVMNYVQRDYVDAPNIKLVTNGSLHGLLDSLDPESSYLSPLEYTDYKDKTANKPKAEAGVAVTKRFGYIGIISVLPDSPAEKAGLHFGDILEKIAGFSTSQMAIEQAQVLLSGEPGAVVKLSVIRRGKQEPQAMDITLAKLAPPKLVEDKLQGDIAYLRVPEFVAGESKQIREDLVQFNKQGAHKLILDLRDCAIGDDSEGIATAQLFLSSGTITTLKGQTTATVVSSADSSKVVWTQPVSVLIGNSTAGPAEILAAAIADNKRGDTIGDRTYGNASVQKLISLDDGSALILTTATYYTPGNKEIPLEGVTPLDPVLSGPSNVADDANYPPAPSSSADDPDVKKAIEVLQGGAAARKAA
jgi:carboxyl-terminal processing protease